ncbi:MAG: hypothetical protein VX589_11295 [Myxococcota bacterium]|nr:hypothetical protein [Myxococcota bacterium]
MLERIPVGTGYASTWATHQLPAWALVVAVVVIELKRVCLRDVGDTVDCLGDHSGERADEYVDEGATDHLVV